MSEISLETVAGKLNRVGYDAFIQALRHARSEGNRHVELAHWLFHILSNPKSDVSVGLDTLRLDRAKALAELQQAVAGLRKNATEVPSVADGITDLLDRGWHHATLMFGESQIRTGHLLVAALKSAPLKRELSAISRTLAALPADQLVTERERLWAGSEEETLRPMDGSGLAAPGTAAAPGGASTALGRFAVDMTALAESGKMDPIVGRDDEIRQIIDILMRRRQNNPVLTGEAGVGKTAVVEGFAQRLASGEVPPGLKGTRLYLLDLGLLQAGASMKGEFEQRLRSVIDEVQSSPVPIILFIDEIHTLMGAGGAAGTNDAANLLKPALARGTLRTIGATTWMEYAKYFEKDPAMTRRFQPVTIDEPSIERANQMLRGIVPVMEKHHGVKISDGAITAAVSLSARYLPSRQLPDKAVSLLDTAAARVAISQAVEPAAIQDARARITALETERSARERQADLGEDASARLTEIAQALEAEAAALAVLEADHAEERAIVERLLAIWADPAEAAARRAEAMAEIEALRARDPDSRRIYAHVDDQAVASVIADWTGIPAGRMVSDELQAILTLGERLKERVIGQDHGLEMIAKRLETNAAKLANPGKPVGVFMLCGPSGVGKTETALALAEQVYGGEGNIITINMSEFQEAHSVSLLKGAPPGYVGYGEGGRLTEAVRRKPYSVVLLDEVEKAHPDVHELFFQVFDKGVMEDGSGRAIDFRNTLILLTSNVGTEAIMDLADRGETRPAVDQLSEALKPWLLKVFPPALLGRIVTIPYFPLSEPVLTGIARHKLSAIVRRMRENHGARLEIPDAVLAHIVAQCRDPDSGGRMVDNIITNSLLPELSREVLTRLAARAPLRRVTVGVEDGRFRYHFEGEAAQD